MHTATTIIDTTATNAHANGFSVKARGAGDIMDAHRQWATRSPDEAVYTVDDLLSHTRGVRQRSVSAVAPWADISVEAQGDDICLRGRGAPVALSHYAMDQLCGVVRAPASYLRRLPTETAARCLADGLASGHSVRTHDARLLVERDDVSRIRAITTTRYSRIWDYDIASRVANLAERSSWGPFTAFRQAGGGTPSHAWGEATPLPLGWVGDRDSFVALVDYDNAVTVGDGQTLARFVLISNSEVGARSFKLTVGLVDFACSNFILWGCQNAVDISTRHIGDAAVRVRDMLSGMDQYRLDSGEASEIKRGIQTMREHSLGDSREAAIARTRQITGLPLATVTDGVQRAEETERYGDDYSAWAIVQGLTEASQHASEGITAGRIATDAAAAKIFGAVL